MKGFTVAPEGMLGVEERKLAIYCCKNGLTPMISPRTLAGHFAYGDQFEGMLDYWQENKERFRIEN